MDHAVCPAFRWQYAYLRKLRLQQPVERAKAKMATSFIRRPRKKDLSKMAVWINREIG